MFDTFNHIYFLDSQKMNNLNDNSIHLIITSPPYWQIKNYNHKEQIGYYNTYEEYIEKLNNVWKECYRVLAPGCRMCINIGDQFMRAQKYGRYRIMPIREDIIRYCNSLKLDYMGAIIWQKVTTCKPSGGAVIMGSYPYPRDGMIKMDYEFILIFKKLGKTPPASKEIKEKSKIPKDKWNEYFYGHWYFPGVKQKEHIAMFPEELPYRLIKMYSFVGENVLDPFLGSGTTTRAAIRLGRNSYGYEINSEYKDIIYTKTSNVNIEIENKPNVIFH